LTTQALPLLQSGDTIGRAGVQIVIKTLKYYRYTIDQNKVLRAIVNVPCFISKKFLHIDLKVPTIREEITKFSLKYRDKITTHPNEHASTLLDDELPRILKIFKPTVLTSRFS
jgi:hypothetical protein